MAERASRWRGSAAAECVHDLHAVAGFQDLLAMPAARNDLAIDLDRHPASGQAGFLQQRKDRGARFGAAGGSVQMDLHPPIVAHRAAVSQRSVCSLQWRETIRAMR
jgi:hypothetical protein